VIEEAQREPYAYLLGMYLGDGHLSAYKRGVHRLRISLDERHIHIFAECVDAVRDVMPANRIGVVNGPGCVVVSSYSKRWVELFPQHGPGKKHERPIVLVDWQREIVEACPERLLRGLIHSDGTRFMNRVVVGGKAYAYPRYNFTNRSADIRGLFTDACDRLGIAWRRMNAMNVSVARREAVAALDGFVGPKR
jgi:hypothetical protein